MINLINYIDRLGNIASQRSRKMYDYDQTTHNYTINNNNMDDYIYYYD